MVPTQESTPPSLRNQSLILTRKVSFKQPFVDFTFGLNIGPKLEDCFLKLGECVCVYIFILEFGHLRYGMKVICSKGNFIFSYLGP